MPGAGSRDPVISKIGVDTLYKECPTILESDLNTILPGCFDNSIDEIEPNSTQFAAMSPELYNISNKADHLRKADTKPQFLTKAPETAP